MHVARTLSILALLSAASLAPSIAHADSKKECAQSYAAGQKAMRSGALTKARDELKVCSRDECLPLVRKDCVSWLDDVNASIPSIVIAVKGLDGSETFDVKLSINGKLVTSKLDVKAIEVDPGTLKLKFEIDGAAPIEQEVVLRQGQKNKLVEVSFAKSPPRDSDQPTPSMTTGMIEPRPKRPSILPWVLGGAGLALAGGGAFFWFKSESDRTDLRDSCAPNCATGDTDDIKTGRLVGDVLMGLGVVAVGAAVFWLITDSSSSPRRAGVASRRWTFTPTGALRF